MFLQRRFCTVVIGSSALRVGDPNKDDGLQRKPSPLVQITTSLTQPFVTTRSKAPLSEDKDGFVLLRRFLRVLHNG